MSLLRATLCLLVLSACSGAQDSSSEPEAASTDIARGTVAARAPAPEPPIAFSDHPAVVHTGRVTLPHFRGDQAPYATWRTLLSEAAAGGPNFAGRYAFVEIGCGTDCSRGFMIELTTGDVAELRHGGGHLQNVSYAHRPESNLMLTAWQDDDGVCHHEALVLGNRDLKLLRSATWPAKDQADACERWSTEGAGA